MKWARRSAEENAAALGAITGKLISWAGGLYLAYVAGHFINKFW
jgi:hypothetical protein